MSQTPLDKETLLKQVYTWASQNTQETRLSTGFKYHWPEAATKLLTALELSQGSVVALVGLSGVGKSSAQDQIAKKLEEKGLRAVHFKWPGYFDQNYDRILEFLHEQGATPGNNELISLMVDKVVKSKGIYGLKERIKILVPYNPFNTTRYDEFMALPQEGLVTFLADYLVRHQDDKNIEGLALVLLGPAEQKRWRKDLVIHLLSQCHSILLDLRDYGTNDVRAMKTDLTEIQGLWQKITEHLQKDTRAPNLVFVLQKELAFSTEARIAHYFLGKARNFEITPFTPHDLLSAYQEEFGSTFPFERKELELVARLSRGVFRRFLKYVQLCLEAHLQLAGTKAYEQPVSAETIDKALSEDEIIRDWEAELRQMFPRGLSWKYAQKIIGVLARADGLFPQNELGRFIQVPNGEALVMIDDAELSRVLSKMEEYGYVRRCRGNSNKKLVGLNI